MKTKELHNFIASQLHEIYPINEAGSITALLLDEIFGITRTDLIVNDSWEMTTNQKNKLESSLTRLKSHEPIQYVLGKADFYNRSFQVNQHVLIPRRETEELVDLIIKENDTPHLAILDIGTGSGCIPITLQLELKDAKVDTIDISEAAIEVAQGNAAKLNAEIGCVKMDALSEWTMANKYDIIVSNPPYVIISKKETMEQHVLAYEPHLALFVENDNPLLFYNVIIERAASLLFPNGKLYFEINEALGKEVKSKMEQKGFHNVRIIKDMQGKDRIVMGQLK